MEGVSNGVQDADALLADSPDRRSFEIRQADGNRSVIGHRFHRGLSTLDARFLINIARPKSADSILDPFAGLGGLVSEAMRRGLRIAFSDIDESLSPGLSALGPESFCIADALSLPLHSGHFDVIVTEPFRTSYRQAVMDSLSEVHRVLKPGGHIQIADILVHQELPQDAKDDIDLWSG